MPGKGKRFEKGNSGGPGGAQPNAGRPPDWLRQECQKHAPKLIEFLANVANGKDVEQAVGAEGEVISVPAAVRDRIKATEILLNRGYGLPNQPLTGPDGESLNLIPTDAVSELAQALRSRLAGGPGT